MANADLSLTLLFDAGADGDRTPQEVYASAIEKATAFKAAVAAATVALPKIHWSAAAQELARPLREALDVPVAQLLVKGWRAHHEMKKYCDRKEYPADQSVAAHLGKHSVEWEQKVKIQLRANGVPVGSPLEFTIGASATLDLATVTIRGGQILALNIGHVALEGSVSLEGQEIISKQFVDAPVPGGRIDLERHGFTLCGHAPVSSPALPGHS